MVTASRLRAVGVPPVVRQVVDGERLDGRCDPAGGLEAQREDADQEVAHLRKLGLVGRCVANALQLAEQLADGVDGDLGLDRRGGGERADRATRIEGTARAVRVAKLLAQPQVEAAAEDAAQHAPP